MAKIGKKRRAANEKVDAMRLYDLNEAMALVKEVNTAKFDASVDLHIRLGVDPRKTRSGDQGNSGPCQMVRVKQKEYWYCVILKRKKRPRQQVLTMLGSTNTFRKSRKDGWRSMW